MVVATVSIYSQLTRLTSELSPHFWWLVSWKHGVKWGQGSEVSRESNDNLDNHFANRCITSDTLWPVHKTEEAHPYNVKVSKQKKIQFNSYVYILHSLVDLYRNISLTKCCYRRLRNLCNVKAYSKPYKGSHVHQSEPLEWVTHCKDSEISCNVTHAKGSDWWMWSTLMFYLLQRFRNLL